MTGFTEVFGGQNIYPAELSLLDLTMTADVALQWPTEVALPGDDVFADIIHVTSDQANRVIEFPDATIAGPGQSTLVNNVGGFTIIIHDNAGGVIASVASGEAWEIYLDDNTTPAGGWTSFQFGTGVSSATAAALAGAGLKAITTTLNLNYLPDETSVGTLAIVDADRALVKQWTGGVGAATLVDPATLVTGWLVMVRNNGTGSLTITPAAGTINGETTLVLAPLSSAIIYTDGADYYTIGLSTITTDTFDYTSISVAGSGDFTLTGPSQLNRIAYKFTGILTAARNVIVPDTIQEYWVNNATTGQFALTVKTSAGTGVVVPPGISMILYCDGTNVVAAEAGYLICTSSLGSTLIPDSVDTDLTFTVDAIDQGSWHAAPSTDFVVPPGVTLIEVSVATQWTGVTGQTYYILSLIVKKNGSSIGTSTITFASPGVNYTQGVIAGPFVAAVSPGDIIKVTARAVTSPGALGSQVNSTALNIKALR